MKIFEVVGNVLDQLYEDIEPASKRDDLIRSALINLSECYRNLHAGHAVNYHDADKRFAYVFKYVTLHSDIIRRTIENCQDLVNIFGDSKVRIACLGGGPGTDLLGVLKFMNNLGVLNDTTFYLIDKEGAWHDSWSDISDELDAGGRMISTDFMKLDVEEEKDWFETRAWLKSDIFIASFFFSELYRIKEKARVFFLSVIEKMKPGAYFIYIDNNAEPFTSDFHRLAEAGGLEIVKQTADTRLVLESGEDSGEVQKYKDLFGYPRLTANVL